MDELKRCPFCGEVHESGPVGSEGGPFAGVEILTCPKLPPDHLYVDQVFPVGPRGRLCRLVYDDGR